LILALFITAVIAQEIDESDQFQDELEEAASEQDLAVAETAAVGKGGGAAAAGGAGFKKGAAAAFAGGAKGAAAAGAKGAKGLYTIIKFGIIED